MEKLHIIDLMGQASPFVWGVMIILLICSLWTWFLLAWKFIETKYTQQSCQDFIYYYQKAQDKKVVYQRLAPKLAELGNLEFLYVDLQQEFHRLLQAHPHKIEFVIAQLEKYALNLSQKQIYKLSRLLDTLATIATTAPFIGLLGTVVGIINVFSALGIEGRVNLASIAPGIAETLVATALGLLAAIPASIAYNWLLARIGQISALHEDFAVHLCAQFSQESSAAPAKA